MRGLDKMEPRFGKAPITRFLNQRFKTEKTVRLLEIGFGEGRALLELANKYPRLRTYGVNYPATRTMGNSKDLLHNARAFKLKVEQLPRVMFHDAGTALKYPSDYFDCIMSQVAFHYIGNKARCIEEIWRILKPGGKAFIHFDTVPDGKLPEILDHRKDAAFFIIYDDKNIISTQTFINSLRKKGFNIRIKKSNKKTSQRQTILLMTKNTAKPLHLPLTYDGNSTIYLTKLKNTDNYKTAHDIWWGTRSVFRMK
jgi:SAM-dependent methyltransferase